ncbi:unnamed protein product [Owenia fusiformis]|uniref:Uncharacterized protein n=1 Tax=Owenia fusiformis TaxID=6347 RepID=A0A8J1TTN3_OWEFU|nr:unnamed protein product [Owenia fusiformis]
MDVEELEKLATANHNEFDRQWNDHNRNWEKLVENFYTTDAVIYPPGSPPVTGLQDIARFFTSIPSKLHLHNSLKEVRRIGEDSYFSIFTLQVTIDDKEVDRFSTCHIWTNVNGVWKMLHDFWNSDYEKVNY